MNRKNKKIRIAVQKRGRLQEPSLGFLEGLGLQFKPNGSKLIDSCLNADVEILYVRNSDIPQYVKYGVADFGIVGENVLAEKKSRLKVVEKLGFGKCSLVIAVPKGSGVKDVRDLGEERIATSYLNILKSYLMKEGVSASIVEINGSVEICPFLNLSDAVCDITQTGRTLVENGLEVVAGVMDSEAVLVCSPFLNKEVVDCDFINLLKPKL